MTRLLRIDASPRLVGSHSRRLGDRIEARLAPRGVVRRDLAAEPLPHLDAATTEAFFRDPATLDAAGRAAIALSDRIVAEVEAADVILITAGMFNFGLPSALKAWIDHLVRVGRTFSFDGATFGGLMGGRRAILALAYGAGGYLDGGPFAGADHLRPPLEFVLRFVGIDDVRTIAVEGTSLGEAAMAPSLASAERAVAALAADACLAA